MLLQLCSHPGGGNGSPGMLQEEPILWLSPTMAAPSSVCPTGSLCGSCCPLLRVPHLSPKTLNSMGMRPTLPPGLFWERCRQHLCWRQHLSPQQRGKEHLHHPGKHQPFQGRSFLKQKENMIQFRLLAGDKLPRSTRSETPNCETLLSTSEFK